MPRRSKPRGSKRGMDRRMASMAGVARASSSDWLSWLRFGLTKSVNPGYTRLVRFGELLRQLRDESGTGIKRLAPELGVSYTYLSKLENGNTAPSDEFISRVAKYFQYNEERLLLAAGKVPEEILRILRENPDEALEFLKQRFGAKNEPSGST